MKIVFKTFPDSSCQGSGSGGYCRSSGSSEGAHEGRGCGELSHCSHKGCRLLVGGDSGFVKMGREESSEICKDQFSSFLLICRGRGYVDVFWFRGVVVASESKGSAFFWICGSVKWSPLASIPGSFFFIDLESVVNRGRSVDFKLVI